AGATPTSSASTSRVASSAATARRRVPPTPSSSRPTTRWASTSARASSTRKRIFSSAAPGSTPATTSIASPAWPSAARTKAKRRTSVRPSTSGPCCRERAMTSVFYVAGAIALVSTLLVITRASAVHALLYLIVSLLAIAVIFFQLGAPFIAALEVIIYAGAIMVVFVFVVMLLNLGPRSVDAERAWLSPAGFVGP